MGSKTPLQQAKELGNQIESMLSHIDIDSLPAAERDTIVLVKRLAVDARLEVRDYEYADSRAEQEKCAIASRKYLERLQASIVKASETNVFGAADVAQLSAHIQKIISDLS